MRFSFRQETLAQLLQQRNFAFCVSGVLLVANLFLSIKVLTHEENWALIPQFDIERRSYVSSSSFSDEYLIDWADALLRDWLTVNPSTVEQKARRFLEISAQNYGDLRQTIQKTVGRVKQERLSTVFYPKSWEIDQPKKRIQVTGDFLTYFGHDRAPIRTYETFWVSYKRGPHGVILCTDIVKGEGS